MNYTKRECWAQIAPLVDFFLSNCLDFWLGVFMDYTEEQFNKKYNEIYASLIKDKVKKQQKAVIFLGGQPGCGKTNFYSQDNNLNGYIVIDGDSYRCFHPEYENIIEYDFENYVERTQGFVNECIERLISDLSDNGYNLIIEGTLRNPAVPIKTGKLLKQKGYKTDLYIIGVDACTSWESTINRAYVLERLGEVPRLVPIDKYNNIVNALPENVHLIEESALFNTVNIIDRNNKIVYSSNVHIGISASFVLKNMLNLEKWNIHYQSFANDFLETKLSFLNAEVIKKRHGR